MSTITHISVLFSPRLSSCTHFLLAAGFFLTLLHLKNILMQKNNQFLSNTGSFFFSLVTLKPEEFIYVFVCLVICQSVWTHGAVGDRALQFLFGVSWQRL